MLELHLTSGKITQKAPMPVAQTDMAVLCTFNSSSTATAKSEPYIYCIGGTQGYDTSKLNLRPQNARYSIIEDKWEKLP